MAGDSSRRRRRVLVVDDHPEIRLLVATRLNLEPGLSVVAVATNGEEAIELARRSKPEAIVLDVQMPVLTGADALPILRSVVPDARIVILSAYVGVQERARPLRADAEVAKGTELRSLVDTLNRLLDEAPAGEVVKVPLGSVPTAAGLGPLQKWRRLDRPGPDADSRRDELALNGLVLALEERLEAARARGRSQARVLLRTRRDVAAAALRALQAIAGSGPQAAGLGVLGERLRAGLDLACGQPPAQPEAGAMEAKAAPGGAGGFDGD